MNTLLKISNNQKRKRFTLEVDTKLISLVKKYDANRWNSIALEMEGRNPKSCRERWTNYLSTPNKNYFIKEEDKRIKIVFDKFGPIWKKLSSKFK